MLSVYGLEAQSLGFKIPNQDLTDHRPLNTDDYFVIMSRLSESGALELMDSGGKELLIVLIVMAVLLVFAIAAVIIFVRVWRKERK